MGELHASQQRRTGLIALERDFERYTVRIPDLDREDAPIVDVLDKKRRSVLIRREEGGIWRVGEDIEVEAFQHVVDGDEHWVR